MIKFNPNIDSYCVVIPFSLLTSAESEAKNIHKKLGFKSAIIRGGY